MSNGKDKYRLWQHSNGTIYVVWTDKDATSSTGVQTRRLSAGTKDRAAAEQFRAQFIAGLRNPKPDGEPTIKVILDRYRDARGVNTRSLSTIDQHLVPLKEYFGDLLPSHLSNSLFVAYAKQVSISAGTLLRRLGILKSAIHYAEGERWIQQQPQFIMPVQSPPPRDIWLTRDQVALLMVKAVSPHVRLFIKIAISTAARSGAILDLTWPQVDFDRKIIDFGRGHGNKRRSIVPMTNDVYESLLEARELAETDHVIEYNGKPLKSIKKAFRVLCKDCGIEASPHVLRHTAATWMVMDRVPAEEVARLLGDSAKNC